MDKYHKRLDEAIQELHTLLATSQPSQVLPVLPSQHGCRSNQKPTQLPRGQGRGGLVRRVGSPRRNWATTSLTTPRAPPSPPTAKPIWRNAACNRSVRRPERSASPSSCSLKMR
jgi:hypothetical protein